MKILLSSAYLSEMLDEIDFANDSVRSVGLEDNVLTITSGSNVVILMVQVLIPVNGIGEIEQHNRDWKSIKGLMNTLPEQPIVLEINSQIVRVILEY